MRHLLFAVVLLFGLAQSIEAQNVKYAIIIPIDADSGAAAKKGNLTASTQGALARLSGRDPVAANEPDNFERFVLTGTDPEIDARIYVGYEATVGPGILDVLASLPPAITQQAEYAAPITQQEIIRRLRNRAMQDGAQRIWILIPGARTDGFIHQKFEQLQP